MPSQRSLSNSFHLWFNPSSFSFYQSISVILVFFLVVIWRPKKSFSLNLARSLEDSGFQLLVILSNYSICQIFIFLTIRSILGVDCYFFSPEAIVPEEFFVLTFQLPLSNYPGVLFKCSLISSWSICSFASKSPSSILVLLILPSDSFSFASHFWFLTVVRSRFFLFDYHINSFVLSNPTGGSWRPSQGCDMSLLNPFQEE